MHISLTILSPLGTRRAAYRRVLFMHYRIVHRFPVHFCIDFGVVTQSEPRSDASAFVVVAT